MRTVSTQVTDLAGADVTARRLGDGTAALVVRNQRGTTVTLRDGASVLRSLLDECRVAVTLLDDPEDRRAPAQGARRRRRHDRGPRSHRAGGLGPRRPQGLGCLFAACSPEPWPGARRE
jgi:hypothetical protein